MHAIGIRRIPSIQERIEKGFEEYIETYNFTDEQIKILRRIKSILAKNYIKNKRLVLDDIFSSPIYEQIIGSKEELNELFNRNFEKILGDLETTICV